MSTTAMPLVPAVRPAWTATLPRQLVLVLAGSAALAISAQVQVPLWPVPITGQTLVVVLLGFALGPVLAMATVAAYLVEGAVGLPVFAGFAAGPGVLVGPTAGYLFGFIVAAGVTGVLARRGWHRRHLTVAAAMIIGNLIIYALGAGYLSTIVGTSTAVSSGVVPFLIGDVIKIGIAVAALPGITRWTERT